MSMKQIEYIQVHKVMKSINVLEYSLTETKSNF